LEVPGHTGFAPVIAPGIAGAEPTVTAKQVAALVPQLLDAVTQIFPVLLVVVTFIDVVP
jgi:hypothetical protein